MNMNKLKKGRKYPLPPARKYLCMGAGLLLLVCTVMAGLYILPARTETVEHTDYSYSVSSDITYRVKLLPNDLFQEEWLDEGLLYSNALTDQIEISFQALFAGSGTASVTGDYEITGIIEGYQDTKDVKRIIYKKSFPLKEGSVPEGSGSAEIKDSLSIKLAPYKEAADLADSILGATPARQFYLLFEGSFKADTAYGEVNEPFSLTLRIPLESSSGLYEITAPSPFTNKGSLTSASQVTVAASPEKAILVLLLGIISLVCILWPLLGTRLPNEEEAYRILVHSIFRKYESRMVRLNQLDRKIMDSSIQVADMDNLVLISEETHQPIYYCPDKDKLPEEGIFYVPGSPNSYSLVLKKPSTTLVPCQSDEVGISADIKKY